MTPPLTWLAVGAPRRQIGNPTVRTSTTRGAADIHSVSLRRFNEVGAVLARGGDPPGPPAAIRSGRQAGRRGWHGCAVLSPGSPNRLISPRCAGACAIRLPG